MLFASTASGILASVYRCPRTGQYVGGVSNVAVAIKVAQYTVQISSQQLTICSSSVCVPKAYGQYELNGGVTVMFDASKFVIRGPPGTAGQRGEVRGYKKNWNNANNMLTGFFYNLYGLLPKSHALAVAGLCKSQDTCANMYEANGMIPAAASFFTKSALAAMNQVLDSPFVSAPLPALVLFIYSTSAAKLAELSTLLFWSHN